MKAVDFMSRSFGHSSSEPATELDNRHNQRQALTATTITDEQIRGIAPFLPVSDAQQLIAGALGQCEPHRNHSRARLAEIINARSTK